MNKYATTLFDIEDEIKKTEKELCSMIDDLVGDDMDMQGLSEFKALLGGM
jgi:type I restriction enzyme M protein